MCSVFIDTKYTTSTPNIPKNINIHYDVTQMYSTCNITFLGLVIKSTLSWKEHISQRAIKMSSAIRALSLIMCQESLLITYYAYAQSIMSYDIIFWDNSTHSNHISKIQKRIVRIVTKARNKASCRPLFRLLSILPFHSQYILSISIFVVKNMDIFISNSDIHSIHTRQLTSYIPFIFNLYTLTFKFQIWCKFLNTELVTAYRVSRITVRAYNIHTTVYQLHKCHLHHLCMISILYWWFLQLEDLQWQGV
jgi:hypothetical protein